MPPPDWALAERALLELNAEGVKRFSERYVDPRGYLRGPEHWGITDGPDETPGVSRAQVVGQLQAIRGQGKNVRLDIIGFGEAPPADALTELAAAGGGTYTALRTTPELQGAIAAAAR